MGVRVDAVPDDHGGTEGYGTGMNADKVDAHCLLDIN